MFDMQTARILYRKLLALYPQRFKDQLAESMEQTFSDLYRERQREHRLFAFTVWTFLETSAGIVREHVLFMTEGDSMRGILSNPTSAAMISFILALPIGLLRLILGSDIEAIVAPIESVITIDGSRPNALGFTIICGGLLLLPVAFLLNLRPMLKRDSSTGKRILHPANIVVGLLLLALLTFTWGGLILEEIYCLQGIQCD
jgi:hypothetical protein